MSSELLYRGLLYYSGCCIILGLCVTAWAFFDWRNW